MTDAGAGLRQLVAGGVIGAAAAFGIAGVLRSLKMSEEPPAKRPRVQPKYPEGDATPVIGTHSGAFHADEALACYLLRLLPEYSNATIVRSRDPKELEKCAIVVDVGGVYDHSTKRYDHHQRGFDETMKSLNPDESAEIKLSSAGLVYFHYGHRVIAEVAKTNAEATEIMFKKMYSSFIQEIDAIDNGVMICPKGTDPAYHINSHVSARVGRLNSPWNADAQDQDGQFAKAMDLIGGEFVSVLTGFITTWMPARELVVAAVKARMEVDKSGAIIEFPRSCPWKSHFYSVEKELAEEGTIKYVLYPDDSGNWRVQCVSLNANSFENRQSLPEPWRGVRDDQLSKLSEIPGCIFVHSAGFIGGNKTRDGALAMAQGGLKAIQ